MWNGGIGKRLEVREILESGLKEEYQRDSEYQRAEHVILTSSLLVHYPGLILMFKKYNNCLHFCKLRSPL